MPFSWQELGGSLDSSYVPIYMRYVHIASYKIDISNNDTDSLAKFLFTPCKELKKENTDRNGILLPRLF